MKFNVIEAIASFQNRNVLCRLVSVSCLIYNSDRQGQFARHIVVDRFYPNGIVRDRIGIFLEGRMAQDVTLRVGHVMKIDYYFTPFDGRVAKSIMYMGSYAAYFGSKCVKEKG